MPAPASEGQSSVSESRPHAGAGNADLKIVHDAVPGRVRINVRALYRSELLRDFLLSVLSTDRHVVSASANILTGNVLIEFRPQAGADVMYALVGSVLSEFRRNSVKEHLPEAAPTPLPEGKIGEAKRDSRRLRKLATRAAVQVERPWHVVGNEEIARTLKSSVSAGLSAAAVKERFAAYGPNLLPESLPRSGMEIALKQLQSLPVLLLAGSALLSLGTGGLAEAVVIGAVVAVNTAVGYFTESRSEATIHSLKRLVRPAALVRRDGMLREIPGEEVVPGDLLVLRPGVYIAADCRVLASENLTVDESSLTGESMPVSKVCEPLSEKELPLADRKNMAYQGTLVTGGQGVGIVVGTGRFSELGRLQAMVGEARAPKTPMEHQLETLGNRLVLLGGGVCGAVFLLGLARGYRKLPMVKSSVSLAVAAIPEGLPALATTVLALGVAKMRSHRVVIRQLNAVETLGCVQAICLDKTGTLTFNRMTVMALDTLEKEYRLENGLISWGGTAHPVEERQDAGRLLAACALCNETEVDAAQGGPVLRGSSTEKALAEAALSCGLDVCALRKRYPLRGITYRAEARNYMISRHGTPAEERVFSDEAEGGVDSVTVVVKGSPLEVLAQCDRRLTEEGLVPLREEDRLQVELANERMAGNAWRLLGVAFGSDSGERETEQNLVWLGLVAMADPVRPGTKELISRFHRAGIDTLMITGDQVPTAYAIGRELGLAREGAPLEIFDSVHLKEMDPELLQSVAGRVQIFARVSPSQKLQIVQALQRGGRVVGMTGDGINDSPALKAADIGIAMGKAGTDVAREVADVVLEDDELETMIVALHHGRAIYENIRKSVRFLLATNLSEIMLVFASLALGLGQALNPMQLLWINLISDIFPGLALSFEPPEPDLLDRSPRDPKRNIVDFEDFVGITREAGIITSGALGAYLYAIVRYGRGGRGGTIAFMSLTAGQLLHGISCRSPRPVIFEGTRLPANPFLFWAIAGSLLLQGGTLVVPGLRRLLGLETMSLSDWAVAGGSALGPLLLNEAAKTAKPGGER